MASEMHNEIFLYMVFPNAGNHQVVLERTIWLYFLKPGNHHVILHNTGKFRVVFPKAWEPAGGIF
jgi:hypothetical protein